MLPSVVSKLIALSIEDEQYFDKVQQLAEWDPTFTVRLIKLANSAANVPVSQITTIQHAISRIGTRQIKGLATAFAITKIFVPTKQSEIDLWVHSIQVAVASQAIAKMAPSLKINPETAYLCGLLHDIGRFILFNKIPEGPALIDEKDWDSPEKLVETELQTCGLNHAVLGGYAAEKWDLPTEVSNAIRNHHRYIYPSSNQVEKKESSLVQVIQVADYFSILLMKDPDVILLPEEELQQLLKERCTHVSWETLPISPSRLQGEAQNIYKKAVLTINGLGISLDK